MSPVRTQTRAVEQFSCLGADCPDTCCQGWGMQLAKETVDQYAREAPALLDAVTSGEAEYIMKRDPVTDYCVKFDQGWCSIHRDYGDAMLGDACHFYPRVTRALGTTTTTTIALSCPEAARLLLFSADGLSRAPTETTRTPFILRNYLPEGIAEADALTIHDAFLALMDDQAVTVERAFMRISSVAHGLERQPHTAWKEALPLYITLADGRITPPEAHPGDLFNLVHAFYGLVNASPNPRPALRALIDRMAETLGITFDATGMISLASDAAERGLKLLAMSKSQQPNVSLALRNYVKAQLSQALFPFAGWGGNLSEVVAILGVRYATVKYALATLGETPSPEAISATVATISRFLDHLSDPTLSLAMYRETGWAREGRLRACIGDTP